MSKAKETISALEREVDDLQSKIRSVYAENEEATMRANRQEEMTALQEQLKDVRLKADSEVRKQLRKALAFIPYLTLALTFLPTLTLT